MRAFERYTASRGRAAVPVIFDRTRRWRRRRPCSLVLTAIALRSLSDLALHVLVGVADALALVRLGRPPLADLRRGLADALLGDPADDDLRRLRHLEADAVGRLDVDRVAEAELQLQILALHLRAVADALDLQALLEPLGDAGDHVGDQRPGQPVQRTVRPAVGRPGDGHVAVVLGHRDLRVDALRQLALRALDGHAAPADRHLDAGGDGNGFLTDAAHGSPDVAQHLAADALFLGLAAGDDAARGGQNRDAHPAQHLVRAVLARVHAPAGLGDALHAADHALTAGAVLERHRQRVEDVALRD